MPDYQDINKLSKIISAAEKDIAERSMEIALKAGASAVQVSLDKAETQIIALLNGEIDNIRSTGDRALTFRIYADGKYGVFSTNRLETNSLKTFMKQAVANVRLLAEDRFRRLPDPAETAKDAIRGDEMGLCWYDYDSVTQAEKLEMAKNASVYDKTKGKDWKLVSEEVEYNNTLTDTYLIDSSGLNCRQIETSFEICSQVTVEDNEGDKYSGFRWEYDIRPDKLRKTDCGMKAVEDAYMQIAPEHFPGGKYNMAVDRRVCGKLIQPILNALSGSAIQQKSSFLTDSLGKRIFGENVTLLDRPREKGKCGSILFDQDGRACLDRDILSEGIVKEYFINTYMSGKLGMPATSDTAIRPVLMPFISGKNEMTQALRDGRQTLELSGILRHCGNGILVTDFNGGNCNPATGEFSYGVEGFRFENGIITKPIESMVITGSMTDLWNALIAAGTDPMAGLSRQIPTIAFEGITFSA